MNGGSPTLRRHRLGLALRRLRERASLTGDVVAARLERSPSWVSRLEAGQIGLRSRDLHDLLDLYNVTDHTQREELEELAREGKQRGWWSKYANALPDALARYVGLESEALELRQYQNVVVPGLLQTEAYARAVHTVSLPNLAPELIDARVEVRMMRQRLLDRDVPLRVSAVLDEAVLYRAYGGKGVLRDQLDSLLAASRRPNIDLRVLHLDQGVQATVLGPFTVLLFGNYPEIVYLEDASGGLFVHGNAVDAHHQTFDRFHAAAMDQLASVAAIERAQGRLT